MKKIIIVIISIFTLTAICIAGFFCNLYSGTSEDIKKLCESQSDFVTYSIEDIAPVYFQSEHKAAYSLSYNIEDINRYLTIEYLSPFGFINHSSILYYTSFYLEEGTMYMCFDKYGNEVYSFIISTYSPDRSEFDTLAVGYDTFDDVTLIDSSAYLFTHYPEILNAEKPECEPYSMHVTSEGTIVRIDYTESDGDYVVAKVSEPEINAIFDVEKFIRELISF